jgi:transposase InsO family protein
MFRLIHAERAQFPVAVSCRILGVSRSGYYRWLGAKPSEQTQSDTRLSAEVREIYREHSGRYGSPRVQRELAARGHRVSRKRVARLMQQQGLRGRVPRRFRRTTDSRHGFRIAPNLLARDFSAAAPNTAWVGDITYVPTSDGWLYLAVLIDLFSRRVVGWAMSNRIDTELALKALQMAANERQPLPGLIHHTDRDCRYASADYQLALRRLGMVTSMSRRADCWDNAVAESFFATLEKELLASAPLSPRAQTRRRVADYIDRYYNSLRRHSTLGFVSPLERELVAA